MKIKRVSAILSFIFIMSLCVSVFAHSGRTDSKGGHKDNKNVSGLGSYHYHCGGHPPHLHTNSICPYSSTASKSVKTNVSVTKTEGNSKKPPDPSREAIPQVVVYIGIIAITAGTTKLIIKRKP